MPEKPAILTASSPLEEAVSAFKSGGIIAYPTETFYGLGVDPFNARAVEALFSLKGRPFGKPVSVLIKDTAMLPLVVSAVSEHAKRLINKFWPGPLTIIFKASHALPPLVTANTGTIGVRVSSSFAAQRLLFALDSPITATSANPSAKPAPATPQEVLNYFDGKIDVLIDAGKLSGRLGSTVVDATGAGVKIVREGEIPSEKILNALTN